MICLVKLSVGSCSVSVGGFYAVRRRWRKGSEEKWTIQPCLCSVTFQTLPTDPPVAVMLKPYQNTRPGGGGSGDRNPSAYYVAFHCFVFLLLSLSCLWLEACIWGIFAVFELVASAFLRVSLWLRVVLPSLISQFSDLKGIRVHLEFSFTAAPFEVFDQTTK